MTDLVILRVNRPYPDTEAYLAAEAWSIDDKAVLLIDQPPLPRDTVVRFEIVLQDGSKPIRAEGKVHKLVPPEGGQPGGLKIRFRRFDAATKAFIDRVMEERRKERRSKRPPSMAPLVLEPEPAPAPRAAAHPAAAAPPEPSAPSDPAASAPVVAKEPSAPSNPVASAPAVAKEPSAPSNPVASAPAVAREPGASRPRAVAPPANRDELLARLRARARKA